MEEEGEKKGPGGGTEGADEPSWGWGEAEAEGGGGGEALDRVDPGHNRLAGLPTRTWVWAVCRSRPRHVTRIVDQYVTRICGLPPACPAPPAQMKPRREGAWLRLSGPFCAVSPQAASWTMRRHGHERRRLLSAQQSSKPCRRRPPRGPRAPRRRLGSAASASHTHARAPAHTHACCRLRRAAAPAARAHGAASHSRDKFVARCTGVCLCSGSGQD